MIALFSATGNSGLIARRLSEILGDSVTPILQLGQQQVEGVDRIIWVFPIHAWSCPEVVEKHIAALRLDTATQHYMVVTCGDDIGRADRRFDRLLRKSGATQGLRGAFSILMPDTYVLLPGFDVDSDELRQQKIASAPARIRAAAEAIARGEAIRDVRPGPCPGLKSGLLRLAFRHFLMSPKPFHVDEKLCRGCGACARVCPLGNITMNPEGHPEWGNRCSTCLACYHTCSSKAIAYGRRTRHKGQYRITQNLPD